MVTEDYIYSESKQKKKIQVEFFLFYSNFKRVNN